MRLDRKFTILRDVEIGRDPLNEPLTEPQVIADGWCGVGPLSRDRFEALGISASVEAVELVTRDASALRGVNVTDRLYIGGVSYQFKAMQDRAGARRGFVELVAVREVAT